MSKNLCYFYKVYLIEKCDFIKIVKTYYEKTILGCFKKYLERLRRTPPPLVYCACVIGVWSAGFVLVSVISVSISFDACRRRSNRQEEELNTRQDTTHRRQDNTQYATQHSTQHSTQHTEYNSTQHNTEQHNTQQHTTQHNTSQQNRTEQNRT